MSPHVGHGRVLLWRLSPIGLGRHAADVGMQPAAGCCVGWSERPTYLRKNVKIDWSCDQPTTPSPEAVPACAKAALFLPKAAAFVLLAGTDAICCHCRSRGCVDWSQNPLTEPAHVMLVGLEDPPTPRCVALLRNVCCRIAKVMARLVVVRDRVTVRAWLRRW